MARRGGRVVSWACLAGLLVLVVAARAAQRELLQGDSDKVRGAASGGECGNKAFVEDALDDGESGGWFQSTVDNLTKPPEDGVRDENFFRAFMKSFLMILVTELGDETFIIAAIMAMRHPRMVVYLGAMSALTFMTVISTALGYVIPNLISPSLMHHAATTLYTIFGLRLLWIGWKAEPHGDNKEEVEEVQQKLMSVEANQSRWQRALAACCTPVLVEAAVLTFLAEWGDRSQIATITLATNLNAVGVTLGATLGHAMCTGAAVLGGQLLAMKISQRTVAFSGAALFLIFAINNALHSH